MSSIYNACYNKPKGELCSAKEFIRRAGANFAEKQIYPYCPECDQRLIVVNAHNPSLSVFFRHNPNLNKDVRCRCSLLDDANDKAKWGCSEFDFKNVTNRKKEFFKRENIINAYWFCWHFCTRKNLKFSQFILLLIKAARKNIWRYAHLEYWMVPYILLTLDDFQYYNSSSNEQNNQDSKFKFEFIFSSEQPVDMSKLTKQKVLLVKRFSDSKKMMTHRDNPCIVSKGVYEKIISMYQGDFYQSKEFSDNLITKLSEVDSIAPYLD